MTNPAPPPAAESELVTVPRKIVEILADRLEMHSGYGISYSDQILEILRAALAAPQPAEHEEAELSYEQICEILGSGHVKWIEDQGNEATEWAKRYAAEADGAAKARNQPAAYRALARILREREAKENPLDPTGEPNLLNPEAVSPSPPENGVWENDSVSKKLTQDFLSDCERDAKSRPSQEQRACESAAAWQAIDSIMERIRHQAEKLSSGIDAAIALAKRHGADIHEFICTHCDGKSANYDCEFCHGDGKYYARVVSEEQP